ncbi:MAG TPA: cation transporter [Ferruginibacter sp.]|jgi:mercuric ion binding protein|nr:cation transporter [Ferruginibacter sp.]
MKAIQLTLLSLIAFVTVSFAQQKAVEKVVIKTPTVVCEDCKERIEQYLMREEGVTAVNVDYKKKTTTVTYITDRINVEDIKAAIATVGYDADDVKADSDSYKRLPACCKKPMACTKPAGQ